MFIRLLSVLGMGAAVLGACSADAGAFSKTYTGGKYKTCYRKVVTPAVYRTITERVMVQPAACTQHRTPPSYGVTAREVVVKHAIQIAHTRPAVYGRVQETRMVRPARTRWTRSRCYGADYRCAVTTPAKYRTHAKRVMIKPRSAWVETRPAVKRVVQQRVMLHPGSVRQVCKPAVYRTQTRQVVVHSASVQWVPVANPAPAVAYHPARYSDAPRMSYKAPMK